MRELCTKISYINSVIFMTFFTKFSLMFIKRYLNFKDLNIIEIIIYYQK